MSKGVLVLLLVCLFLGLAKGVIQINNDTLQYVDDAGRTRLFHGLNGVYKIPPWHPELEDFNTYSSMVTEDFKDLQRWGFNVMRLGVMWPGVMPSENVMNTTYLETMSKLVTQMGEYGIYTIVDCHQDVFSRYFCGEGVPDWLVLQNSTLEFPLPIRKPDTMAINETTGYPEISSCEESAFFQYYFTDAVSYGFQTLYDNTNHVQDQFVSYWQQVALAFRNNPYVLGYELINEPWAGDYLSRPELLLPKHADQQNLFPMYQNLNHAIREIDNEHIIFFESAVSDITPCGFTEGPGGPAYNDRQAYSYHVYCAPTDQDGDPTKPRFCNVTLDWTFHAKQEDRRNLAVAGMMTEFGALRGTPVGVDELNYLLDLADREIQSWCYWQYKFFADLTTASADGAESFYVNGNLDTPKVKALARTYAPVIAGVPSRHRFDPHTGEFTLDFTINSNLGSNCTSTIFASQEFYYPNGVMISVSSNLVVSSQSGNYIQIDCQGTGRGRVQITPSSAQEMQTQITEVPPHFPEMTTFYLPPTTK